MYQLYQPRRNLHQKKLNSSGVFRSKLARSAKGMQYLKLGRLRGVKSYYPKNAAKPCILIYALNYKVIVDFCVHLSVPRGERTRPHVSVFVLKHNFFSPFLKKFASTGSVFGLFSPFHTKTLKGKYC